MCLFGVTPGGGVTLPGDPNRRPSWQGPSRGPFQDAVALSLDLVSEGLYNQLSCIEMEPSEIARTRRRLKLTQIDLGKLLGAHPMTVSKWERGVLRPTPYQTALLVEFRRAARQKAVRGAIGGVLVGAGIAAAIYLLLKSTRD